MQNAFIPEPAEHARALVTQGKHAEAIDFCRHHLKNEPKNASIWFWLGSARHMQNSLPEALEAFTQALNLESTPTHLSAAATLLAQLGRYEEALPLASKALQSLPTNPVLMANLATVKMNLGQLGQALEIYGCVLESQPGQFNALINRGIVLARLGRYQEAVAHNKNTIALLPNVPEAYFNYADTLILQFRYPEALIACDQGLALAPSQAELLFKKGLCLAALGEFSEADTFLAKARRLNPQVLMPFIRQMGIELQLETIDIDARLIYMEARYKEQMHCFWKYRQPYLENFGQWLQQASGMIRKVGQKEFGFQMFSLGLDAGKRLSLARMIAASVKRNAEAYGLPAFEFPSSRKEKLRIGYVSPDFRQHPVGTLTRQIYALHDREQFEIFGYSLVNVDEGDPIHADIVKGCDTFRNVAKLNDVELAQLIHRDQIDILIDLAGYTTLSRSELFALRPAPVQISYAGFAESMGADFVDYVVTDAQVYPPGSNSFWHEKVIRLPYHSLPYDTEVSNAPIQVNRADFGLLDDVFVFCCLNNCYKIEPVVFDAWISIMKAVPDSVLWLFDKDEQTRTNLQSEAQARGVDGKRLVFAPFMEYKRHVQRYQMADLFLDTIWHNAHTTALEALWQGLPLLTKRGEVVSARLASSCLQVLGLNELIVTDMDEYVGRAVYYGQHPQALTRLREKLKMARDTSPLFNTVNTVMQLEYAYKAAWKNYQEDNPPQDIDVPDLRMRMH